MWELSEPISGLIPTLVPFGNFIEPHYERIDNVYSCIRRSCMIFPLAYFIIEIITIGQRLRNARCAPHKSQIRDWAVFEQIASVERSIVHEKTGVSNAEREKSGQRNDVLRVYERHLLIL